jgi:cation transport regulator ChaC
MLYFAYGSNMLRDRLEERVGSVQSPRCAHLHGWRLAFHKWSPANHTLRAGIVRAPGNVLWGVVYDLTDRQVMELDRYEGVADGHYTKEYVTVTIGSGQEAEALVYVAGNKFIHPEGAPPQAYLDCVVDGAREHGLPEEYISTVESVASGSSRGWRRK